MHVHHTYMDSWNAWQTKNTACGPHSGYLAVLVALKHASACRSHPCGRSGGNEWGEDEDGVDERDEVNKDEIEMGDVLGVGAFAEVRMAWWRRCALI
jgi:hypothetical protein